LSGLALGGADIQLLLRDILLDNVDLGKYVHGRTCPGSRACASRLTCGARHPGAGAIGSPRARKLQQNAETDPLAGMGGMGGMGGSGTFGTIRRQSTISKKDKQVLLPAVATGDTPTMLYLYGSWYGDRLVWMFDRKRTRGSLSPPLLEACARSGHRYAELACQRFINGSTLFQEAPTNRLPPTMVLHSEARKQFLSIRQPYLKIDRYADLHGTARAQPSLAAAASLCSCGSREFERLGRRSALQR